MTSPPHGGWWRSDGDGVRVTIAVQPGARATTVTGVVGDARRVKVAARPVDGAANAALVALLADRLDVARSRITIVRGHAGRRKTVHIDADVSARLDGLVADP